MSSWKQWSIRDQINPGCQEGCRGSAFCTRVPDSKRDKTAQVSFESPARLSRISEVGRFNIGFGIAEFGFKILPGIASDIPDRRVC